MDGVDSERSCDGERLRVYGKESGQVDECTILFKTVCRRGVDRVRAQTGAIQDNGHEFDTGGIFMVMMSGRLVMMYCKFPNGNKFVRRRA